MENTIREVNVEREDNGTVRSVQVVFGPHYFIQIELEENSQLMFYLGATYHRLKARANEVSGELEKFIGTIRSMYPENSFD